MNDHVTATLDGAVPAAGGAMRWQPPTTWAALRRVFDRVADFLREFAAAVKDLLETMLMLMRPVLATVASWERRHRARLSAMRREYHRRRR